MFLFADVVISLRLVCYRPLMFTMVIVRTYLLTTLVKLGPPRFRRFLVDLLPFENVRRLRDCVDVMHNTSLEIFEAKKRALKEGDQGIAEQIGGGKDIMSILCMCNQVFCNQLTHQVIWSVKANMEASGEDRLSDSEVVAQVFLHAANALMLLTNARPFRIDVVRTLSCRLSSVDIYIFTPGP
jgi:hypothetical protein